MAVTSEAGYEGQGVSGVSVGMNGGGGGGHRGSMAFQLFPARHLILPLNMQETIFNRPHRDSAVKKKERKVNVETMKLSGIISDGMASLSNAKDLAVGTVVFPLRICGRSQLILIIIVIIISLGKYEVWMRYNLLFNLFTFLCKKKEKEKKASFFSSSEYSYKGRFMQATASKGRRRIPDIIYLKCVICTESDQLKLMIYQPACWMFQRRRVVVKAYYGHGFQVKRSHFAVIRELRLR